MEIDIKKYLHLEAPFHALPTTSFETNHVLPLLRDYGIIIRKPVGTRRDFGNLQLYQTGDAKLALKLQW